MEEKVIRFAQFLFIASVWFSAWGIKENCFAFKFASLLILIFGGVLYVFGK